MYLYVYLYVYVYLRLYVYAYVCLYLYCDLYLYVLVAVLGVPVLVSVHTLVFGRVRVNGLAHVLMPTFALVLVLLPVLVLQTRICAVRLYCYAYKYMLRHL